MIRTVLKDLDASEIDGNILTHEGYTERFLFSLDRPIYNDFASPSKAGLDYPADVHISRYGFLFTNMLPAFIAAGCTTEDCRLFTVKNPLGFITI